MIKFNSYVFFICLCFSLPTLSELRFPEIPSKNKPLSIKLQTEYYQTRSNYIQPGQYTDLPAENHLRYIAIHPSLSYSPFPLYINFELFANNFYAFSKTLNTKREVFRPAILGAGLSFYHKIKNVYAGAELRGGYPLYGNFQSPNEMIVGDGAYFVEPGLWFLVQPSQMFYIYLNTAFRYRSLSLSGLLLNKLGGVLKTPTIDVGVSMDSFFSVLSDGFTNQPEQRLSLINKVNGGSYRFYSVNPSVFLSWVGWMELKFKPLFTKLYFHWDTLGQNYAKGFSCGIIAQLKWHTKSSIADRRGGISFDFDEDSSSSGPDKDSHFKEKESYFEEKEDPYSKKNFNQELKQELDSLRY